MIPYFPLLADIAIVVALARLVGGCFERIGQPRVAGEIVAGIMLGPSLLQTHLSGKLFPATVVPLLTVIGTLGVTLFMFIVGAELDLTLIRGRGRIAAAISLCSIALPFGLGALLGLHLRHLGTGNASALPFALFIGTAMSITAFPVLARILSDRSILGTPLGTTAMASAALDDVTAWTLLAVVSAIAGHDIVHHVTTPTPSTAIPGWRLWLFVPYVVVILFLVRPLLRQVLARYDRRGALNGNLLAITLAGLLFSAAATQWIGLHYIFGAFIFGAAMPRDNKAAFLKEVVDRLEPVSVLLLLPVFFVVTGLSVDVRHIGQNGVIDLLLVLAVATVGKFVGAYVGARSQHVPHHRATALGVLMNTRGLTELIVLSVGINAGIINKRVNTIMVVMAVVTTIMTGPLFRLVYPNERLERDVKDAEQARLRRYRALRVLVILDEPSPAMTPAIRTALAIGGYSPIEVVLGYVQPLPTQRTEIGVGLSVELAQAAKTAIALQSLEGVIRESGHDAATISRMSASPESEVLEIVRSVAPDVVVVSANEDIRNALVAAIDEPVLFASGTDLAAEGPVLAAIDATPSGAAAAEIGLRIAAAQRSQLLVVGQQRTDARATRESSALIDAATVAGVKAGPWDQTGSAAIVVLPADGTSYWADRSDGMVVRVHARIERDGAEISTLGADLASRKREAEEAEVELKS